MIIINDKEKLQNKSCDATEEDVKEIIPLLEKELHLSALAGNPGVGLAAPQIGIFKNIAIIRFSDHKKYEINLINPTIIEKEDPFIFKNEGCLSFPNQLQNSKRFNQVTIKHGLNQDEIFVATGLLAVVCQHEIDHLNGKLFFESKYLPKKKMSPNDPCDCGKINSITNKPFKYKKCCGA